MELHEIITTADPDILSMAMVGIVGLDKTEKILAYYVELKEQLDEIKWNEELEKLERPAIPPYPFEIELLEMKGGFSEELLGAKAVGV